MEVEGQFAAAEDEGVRWNAASNNNSGTIRARTGVGASDEISPLLPGVAEDGSTGNGDEPRDSTWTGSREFEGIPWWKKPSVRYSRLLRR